MQQRRAHERIPSGLTSPTRIGTPACRPISPSCAGINTRHREGRFAGDRQLQLRAWARDHRHRFSVDVAENHEAMRQGQVSHTVFVTVLADDAVEASLLAAQMASRHGIATAVHPLIT